MPLEKIKNEHTLRTAKELMNAAIQEIINLQEQLNNIVVDGDSSVEAAQARVNKVGQIFDTLKDRLDDSDDRIITMNNIQGGNTGIWKPPIMPDTFRGNGRVPDNYVPDDHLAALLDPLVDDDYVTKINLGKDASGTYDIWRYDFTPKHYEKTILITCCVHGNEYTGFYWFTQFAELLVNNWHEHPQLAYIRKNVRIVSVPIVNPYGFANQQRFNANGIDLNRQFDYNHGKSVDGNPQGDEPFSEAEAIIIRDLMGEIAEECICSLDFHTTTTEGSTQYVIYYPRWLKNNVSNYLKLVDDLIKEGEYTGLGTSTLPTLTNYAVYKYGFNGANPEFVNGLYGPTRSSIEMTRAMEFFGNLVIQASRLNFHSKAEAIDKPQVFSIRFDHRTDGGPISFATQEYTSQITKTMVRFPCKNEGIFEVYGTITLSTSQDAEISIIPQLYQVSGPDFSFNDTLEDEFNAIILNTKAGQEYHLPFSAEIMCQKQNIVAPDNTNSRAKEIVFQLRTKITNGSGSIKFIKATARFTPTTSGDRFRRYGLNPARILYPTGEETEYEF